MTGVRDASSALQMTQSKNRGIVIILVALTVFVIIGLAGLAIDLCRIYITQNELQNFTDSGAIWAVSKLDGTVTGIAAAKVAALPETDSGTNVNRWGFGHEKVISGVTTVEFATDVAGLFVANPPTPVGYRFARVSTQSTIPIYFASIFPGVGFNSIVGAFSIAGQAYQNAFGDGIFPFSPDAHNCGDPNYGFLYGQLYTLRWGNAVGGYDPDHPLVLKSQDGADWVTCPGSADMWAKQFGFTVGATGQSQYGHIDLFQYGAIGAGGGAALIKATVLGAVSYQNQMQVGDIIDPKPGNMNVVIQTVRELVASDGDPFTPYYYEDGIAPPGYKQTSTTWPPVTVDPGSTVFPSQNAMANYRPPYPATYHLTGDGTPGGLGTGERMVVVPINCGLTRQVLGFAGMLLPPEPCPQVDLGPGKDSEPCCGYYLGPATLSGGSPGLGAGAGFFRIMLFR